MINSLMSRMGEAQKLSIPQLQKAIQDGSLPPYIGIPLLQDKMKQSQMAKAGQQQPQQPPIAEQVMQEAQQHDRGVEQLPSNLPTEEMAGGGIVAFAGGGLNDDEIPEQYQDQMDEQEDEEAMQSALENQAYANEGIGAIPNRGVGLKITEPVPAGASKGIQYKGEDYDALLAKASKEHGVPFALLKHTAEKETGGLSPEKRATAVSKAGAVGLMQFMPKTAQMYGIDPTDPAQSADAAGRMYKDLLGHYKGDQRLAAMGYNWGQGNVDKWLQSGAKPEAVPKETRLYAQNLPGTVALAEGGIVALAKGGEVKHYDGNTNGSLVSDDTLVGLEGSPIYVAPTSQGSLRAQEQNYPPLNRPKNVPVNQSIIDKWKQQDQDNAAAKAAPTNLNVPSQAAAPMQSEPSTTVDPYQKLMDKMEAREAQSGKQKTIDNYMALLTAGLGMMGGSSQYAMENIGKGALAGVQQLGESRKLAASEEANRDKNMAALVRAKELSNISQATQGRLSSQFQQAQQDKTLQQAQTNFQTALKIRTAMLSKDPTFATKSEAEQNALIYNSPDIQKYAQAAGFDPSLFAGSGTSTSTGTWKLK